MSMHQRFWAALHGGLLTRARTRGRRRAAAALLVFALGPEAAAVAQDAREKVSPFYGSFSSSVPIAVPAFRGLEPRLALTYTSEARNGLVGVGWNLAGISSIERVSAGRGTPQWDATDTYLLDGQELVACQAGTASPSCTTGGTHATKIESYVRIKLDATANTFTVWGKDGTRTTFSPTVVSSGFTLRWGQAATVDTYGNTVTYTWSCVEGDCYPDTITYGAYSVGLVRESRPDPMRYGAGYTIGETKYRLGLVVVRMGEQPIRAYKLAYATSAVTGRSLLGSVQEFGRDVAYSGTTV